MLKKTITILLISSLLMPIISVSATANNSDIFIYPGYEIVTEEQERSIELRNQKVDRDIIGEGEFFYPTKEQQQMIKTKKEKNNDNTSTIMGVIIDDGTTQVVNITPYSNGTLIQEQRVQGTAQTVWNVSMYVAGLVFDTVGGIIIDIINYYVDTVDKSKGSDTYTFKSYRYIGKDVKVYDTDHWETWYQARSRENYAHTLSTYVNLSGITRTRNYDYTIDRGYSPVKTEFSANYNNNSELSYRGWYNWYVGRNAYRTPEYGY